MHLGSWYLLTTTSSAPGSWCFSSKGSPEALLGSVSFMYHLLISAVTRHTCCIDPPCMPKRQALLMICLQSHADLDAIVKTHARDSGHVDVSLLPGCQLARLLLKA